MISTTINPGRIALKVRKSVIVIESLPKNTEASGEVAFVMDGVRCLSIRVKDGLYSAAWHQGFNVWHSVATNQSENNAFYAVCAFLDRVSSIPQHYTPEYEQAIVDAAKETLKVYS